MQLTVQQAAGILKVSEETVYQWIRNENLPAARFGDRFHINHLRLMEWAQLHFLPTAVEGKIEQPLFVDALRRGGVHAQVPGTTLSEVVHAITALLPLPKRINRSFLSQMLLSRRNGGWISNRNGIALPQARSPIILHIEEPVVSLCYLAKPLRLHAKREQLVYAIFTAIIPAVQFHLNLLSRLSLALRNSEILALLQERAAFEPLAKRLSEFREEDMDKAPVGVLETWGEG